MALDFPASSASPFTAPNGVIYTWNTAGYWEAKADPNDFDSDYLKLNATNGPVTGDLTFEQTTTHEKGLKVTDGYIKVENGANCQILNTGANELHFRSVLNEDRNTSYTGFLAEANTSVSVNGLLHGFRASSSLGYAPGATRRVGFYANLGTNNPENYNIYVNNNAPSFFAGSTYIGGDTSRNTFDLWKSTLNEEQLEQLEAGTLVAPANVSLPGDGEFARQWYYDQQDAETQALIDSGELEYPTHLAAATFTDTFALSDNTNINLLSNGRGEFSGGVKVTGGQASAIVNGIGKASGQNRLVLAADSTIGGLITSTGAQFGRYTPPGDFALRANVELADISTGSFTTIRADNVDAQSPANISLVRGVSVQGIASKAGLSVDEFRYFSLEDKISNKMAQVTYGYYSDMQNSAADVAAGKTAYNFYAAGDAPSYFKGGIQFDQTGTTGNTGLLMENYEEGVFTVELETTQNISNIADNTATLINASGKYILCGNILSVILTFQLADENGNDLSGDTTGNELISIKQPFAVEGNSRQAAGTSCALQTSGNNHLMHGYLRFAAGNGGPMRLGYGPPTGRIQNKLCKYRASIVTNLGLNY